MSKRWPNPKTGSRSKPSQLERYGTIDPLVDKNCIMLDGDCKCEHPEDCIYYNFYENPHE